VHVSASLQEVKYLGFLLRMFKKGLREEVAALEAAERATTYKNKSSNDLRKGGRARDSPTTSKIYFS
jgi:hypothetical protein